MAASEPRRVILNADDFGACSRTNAAVLRAHREGVLTSASLMVNEPGAAEAVEMAREAPGLSVGLHLVLSDGAAALSASRAPRLVGSSGRFRNSPALAGIICFFSASARKQVRQEIAAQLDRFAATGLPLSHVDGHQHLHVHPVIWDALVALCRGLGPLYVRIPNEEFRPATPGGRAGRMAEWLAFRALRRRCLKTLAGTSLRVVDRVYGHLETGRMTDAYLLELLDRLAGRTNEVYFHPGTRHARPMLAGVPGMDVELHALLSPRVTDRLAESSLVLTNFAELAVRGLIQSGLAGASPSQ